MKIIVSSFLVAFFLLFSMTQSFANTQVGINDSSMVEVENSEAETSDTKLFLSQPDLGDLLYVGKDDIIHPSLNYVFYLSDRSDRPPQF